MTAEKKRRRLINISALLMLALFPSKDREAVEEGGWWVGVGFTDRK